MKKRLAIVGASACLALILAGCASGSASSSEASASSAAASAAASSEPVANMANPWSDVASAEEAAAGAGIDSFSVPLGVEISLGTIEESQTRFSCMKGIAQMDSDVAAVGLCIRKGTADAAVEEGDISGDYGTYAHTWTQNVKGLELTCSGNREGEATKTIWTSGDYCYCILAMGLGGDTDYGLSEADLNSLVNAIQ